MDDPRIILRILRSLLKRNPDNRLVLSTPDRERIDGKHSSSVPDNPTHIRQWTASELERALISGCFIVESIKHVPENQFDDLNRTILTELSCNEEAHHKALAAMNLPAASDHLVITTEHSRAQKTGGIGTYYEISEHSTGMPRLILYVGGAGLPEHWSEYCGKEGWMHVAALNGRADATYNEVSSINHHAILDAVFTVIFLYDQIKLIEYQDYLGIGSVVAQAKRAGLIPNSIFILAYAHGNHLYLDNAAGEINRFRPLENDVRERISLELADLVAFPSVFLRDLYLNIGQLKISNHVLQPYPIELSNDAIVDTDYSKVSTLVFYGKHSKQKGYFDFCEAVVQLLSKKTNNCTHQIKKVVILGSVEPDPRLFEFPGVEINYGIFPHNEVIDLLHKLSKSSLVVLPYKGDNHPLSLFEVMSSGSQLLAYRAGGLPEQIPQELHDKLLCNPNAEDLAQAIETAVGLSFWDRCCLIRDTKVLTTKRYEAHSQQYRNFIESLKVSSDHPIPQTCGGVSVIIPNYNGERHYLEDALFGIRNSFRRPDAIFIIDDCSTDRSFEILSDVSAETTDLPIRVLRNPTNKGLAGTRNVGLSQCTTEYVCAHDNDNILHNRFLEIACRIMDLNPSIDAVTCWTRGFSDGDDWQAEHTTTLDYSYRPIGPDIGLGLTQNTFGDAMAVYRTATLKKIGGWDASSKSMWEDWQLFLKLTANGHNILVIPKELILYRVRKNSMMRTYPEFNGWMRISNTLPMIPDNYRFGLLRALVLPDWRAFSSENNYLTVEVHRLTDRLNLIENSWTWRISKQLIALLSKFPRLRAVLKFGGRNVAKVLRR